MFSPVTVGIIFALFCTTLGGETRDAKGKEETVCNDQACRDLAEKIMKQMGSSPPCDDFHSYVCGNWSGYQETKVVELKEKAVKDLIALLEVAAAPSPTSPNATDKLLSAYRSCTRKGGDKEALNKSVRAVLGRYWLGGWPILPSDEGSRSTYVEILQKLGPRPLFPYSVEVTGDTAYVVMKKPDHFYVSGVDYPDYYEEDAEVAVSDSDAGTATSLPDNYLERSEASYKLFIVKAITLINDSVDENKAADIADDIIYVEKNLSKLAHESAEQEETMNISQLTVRLPDNFPMDTVLNKDFGYINFVIEGKTQVKTKCMEYYKSVIQYLKNQTNMGPLINFALWTWVRSMAEAEGTLLHDIYLEYQHNTSIYKEEKEKTLESSKEVISKEDENKSQCLRQLLRSDVMYTAGASYYSMRKFNGSSKTEATKIFYFILKEFRSFIEKNSWMSDQTKQDALQLLSSMDVVIGYPDWMLQNSTIDYLYKYASSASENASFVEHYHNLQENNHFQSLLVINSCYFNKTNEEVTLRSHAIYKPKFNILGYPAASLVTHYRGHPIPRAVNFGTIGTIFAQLLSAVVERFNGTIPPNEFWDKNTTTQFCSNSDCLNNTEECSDQQGEINNSSYQSFRDYIGVRISHKALKESKRNYTGPFLLPGEKFDTEDEIFFDAFGSLYCPYSLNENKKPEPVEARAFIPVDDLPKSLNEVLSKYNEFNSTFNCTGDVMDTCHLMPPGWKKEVPAC